MWYHTSEAPAVRETEVGRQLESRSLGLAWATQRKGSEQILMKEGVQNSQHDMKRPSASGKCQSKPHAISPHSHQNGYYQKEKKKCWGRCGELGNLMHCWWKFKSVQPLGKTVWMFLKKLKQNYQEIKQSHYRAYTHRKYNLHVEEVSPLPCLLHALHSSQGLPVTCISGSTDREGMAVGTVEYYSAM